MGKDVTSPRAAATKISAMCLMGQALDDRGLAMRPLAPSLQTYHDVCRNIAKRRVGRTKYKCACPCHFPTREKLF